jgi:hypothetical protein
MPTRRRVADAAALPEPSAPPSRRKFLLALGATAAVPWVAAWPAAAQSPPAPTTAKPEPAPAPAPTADPEAAAAQADSRSLLEILRRRHGANWTPEQLEALRSDLEDGVGAGRLLRKLPLRNADEPAIVFVARGPEV